MVVRGVGVDTPLPPGVRAEHHDLPSGAQRGAVRDLHQDRGEEGGGGELEDPGDQTLSVTERREVEDLVRSELSDRQSERLLSTLWWNDNPDTAPSAACNINLNTSRPITTSLPVTIL